LFGVDRTQIIDMKTVLFLDNTYPQAYNLKTLQEKAIGGTEASIIKTAQILSNKYKVFVAQKYREEDEVVSDSLAFISKRSISQHNADYVVVLRKYQVLKEIRGLFPHAKLFLWIHTYKNFEYIFKRCGFAKNDVTVICNSETHKKSINRILNQNILGKFFTLICKKTNVKFCYNPITKPESPKKTRDINKLLFFSSPNKGLEQVINCFNEVIREMPEMKLFIANPGYKTSDIQAENKNIIVLGSLPYHEMMKHVAESLCIFYPQNTFAETFGLIYAEANALGIPVLAHDIGSAREILHSNNNLIDATNSQQIINTLKSWQNDLPKVEYKENFNEDFVFQQWDALFSQSQFFNTIP
jgi:glycosyltransferase involved in cell wall biosynthesis